MNPITLYEMLTLLNQPIKTEQLKSKDSNIYAIYDAKLTQHKECINSKRTEETTMRNFSRHYIVKSTPIGEHKILKGWGRTNKEALENAIENACGYFNSIKMKISKTYTFNKQSISYTLMQRTKNRTTNKETIHSNYRSTTHGPINNYETIETIIHDHNNDGKPDSFRVKIKAQKGKISLQHRKQFIRNRQQKRR